MQQRLSTDSAFLWIDEVPGGAALIRRRQIVVAPVGLLMPAKVPSGLVHDWIGAAFIPNVTVNDVLSIVRNYAHYRDFYRPNVIDSKVGATSETEDEFSIVLMNKSLFSKTVLDGEYQASYVRIDPRRLYSVSQTTRIREITEYGAPGQHTLPEDGGTGLIWRLYSVTRLEERDGGVYIEIEVIALSRDIPTAVRWIVEPMVRRMARESLVTALRQTKDAVQSAEVASRADPGRCRSDSRCCSFHCSETTADENRYRWPLTMRSTRIAR